MNTRYLNPLVLDPRSFPLVRPHITCVDHDVFFGSWQIARISNAQSDFLKQCAGQFNLADAVRQVGGDPSYVTHCANWLLWWEQKISAAPVLATVDRLVLTTSHTAAWLGMGGRMLIEAQEQPAVVITCFGSLGETRFAEAFPTLAEVSMAARDEAAFVARLCGVQQRMLEFPDHTLRSILEAKNRSASGHVPDALRAALIEIIEEYQPSQIFAPAPIGNHADSRLLFEVLLSLFAEGYIEAEIHLFEDAPAIHGNRNVDEFLGRFEGSYLTPHGYYVDVSASFARKSSMIDVFRCTLDKRMAGLWLRSAERNAAIAGTTAAYAERFWELKLASIQDMPC